MAIVLFDGPASAGLHPLTYTRAVAGLRMGILTIQQRWQHLLQTPVLVEALPFLQPLYPPVPQEVHTFIDAQVMPSATLLHRIEGLQQGEVLEDEHGIVACKGSGTSYHEVMDHAAMMFSTIGAVPRLQYPHQLMQWNNTWLAQDYSLVTAGKISQPLPATCQAVCPENIFIEEGASVNFSILNAAEGPVYIGKNARIMEGCLLRGPLAVCEEATLKMGTKIYGATTLGPHCTAGGELKNVVMQEYSNKGHDGYLGDSVIGQWCNFGAGSSNSNLKNTAGNVMLWNDYAGQKISAGNKCGVIMGDYCRIAINSSINTGSVFGVCCHVYGQGLLPTALPSFSWGIHGGKYELSKAFVHLAQWKKMKHQTLTDAEKRVLQHIFEAT